MPRSPHPPPDLPWSELGPLVFLDVETSDLDREQHIIEVAALRWEDGRETDRLVTLVDPGTPTISYTHVHGISRADLDGAPTWPAVLPALRRVLDGATVVAHNAAFEARALQATLSRHGGNWDGPRLCTYALARRAHPERSGRGAHTLGNLLALHRIEQPGRAHAALPDAAVLRSLAACLLARAPDAKVRSAWLRAARKEGAGVRWPVPAGGHGLRTKSR